MNKDDQFIVGQQCPRKNLPIFPLIQSIFYHSAFVSTCSRRCCFKNSCQLDRTVICSSYKLKCKLKFYNVFVCWIHLHFVNSCLSHSQHRIKNIFDHVWKYLSAEKTAQQKSASLWIQTNHFCRPTVSSHNNFISLFCLHLCNV